MAHLTIKQSKRTLEVLKADYVEFYLKCCRYNQSIESATSEPEKEDKPVLSDDVSPQLKNHKMGKKSSSMQESSKVSCGVPYSDNGHLSHLFEGGLLSLEE